MTNLVWDDSRIDECAEVAARAVIDFIEEFNEPGSATAYRIAGRVEHLIREELAALDTVECCKHGFPVLSEDCPKCGIPAAESDMERARR